MQLFHFLLCQIFLPLMIHHFNCLSAFYCFDYFWVILWLFRWQRWIVRLSKTSVFRFVLFLLTLNTRPNWFVIPWLLVLEFEHFIWVCFVVATKTLELITLSYLMGLTWRRYVLHLRFKLVRNFRTAITIFLFKLVHQVLLLLDVSVYFIIFFWNHI